MEQNDKSAEIAALREKVKEYGLAQALDGAKLAQEMLTSAIKLEAAETVEEATQQQEHMLEVTRKGCESKGRLDCINELRPFLEALFK